MKQTKLFLIVAILVSAFWSCKDSSELTNAIPASAIAVIHIDSKSLLTKADYKPLENKYLKELFEKEKNNGSEKNKKMTEKLESILKNPNSTGIDLISDCFIYIDSTTTGIVLKMNDAKKLKELLTESLGMPGDMLKEEDGISTVDLGMGQMGWTNDKLLIVMNSPYAFIYGYSRYRDRPDMVAMVKKQLKQSAGESINSKKAFAEFVGSKKDISVFYSYDNVAGMWGGMLAQMAGIYGEMSSDAANMATGLKEMIKGVSTGAFISFEKGEVVGENKFYYDSPESEKRYTDMVAQVSGELKGDQMKFFTGKPLFLASFALKGSGLYNVLSDLGVIGMIENNAGSDLREMGIDLKTLITNAEGDFSIALNGIKTYMKKFYNGDEYTSIYPEFTVFADMQDARPTWDLIKSKIKETGIYDSTVVEINPTTYSVKADDITIYMGINNNTFYATNSEDVYKNVTSNADAKNDFASMAKGKTSFIYGNLNPLKNSLVDEFMGTTEAEFARKGLDLLGDYSYISEKNMTGKGKIVINDKGNSLAVICKYIDSIISYTIEQNM
jgi:hypothetical protein